MVFEGFKVVSSQSGKTKLIIVVRLTTYYTFLLGEYSLSDIEECVCSPYPVSHLFGNPDKTRSLETLLIQEGV